MRVITPLIIIGLLLSSSYGVLQDQPPISGVVAETKSKEPCIHLLHFDGLSSEQTICSIDPADLASLEQEVDSDDPILLFNLAMAHYASIQAVPQDLYSPEIEFHISQHLAYLERILTLYYNDISSWKDSRVVVKAVRWMAHAHHFLLLQPDTAQEWYELWFSVASGSESIPCLNEYSRLQSLLQQNAVAWSWSRNSISLHDASDNLPCGVALQGARAALNTMQTHFNAHKYALGHYLLKEAKKQCNDIKLKNLYEASDILVQLDEAYMLVFGQDQELYDPATHCITEFPYFHEYGAVQDWPEQAVDASLLIKFFGKEIYCNHDSLPPLSAHDDVEYEQTTAADMEGMPLDISSQIGLLMLLDEHRLTGWW